MSRIDLAACAGAGTASPPDALVGVCRKSRCSNCPGLGRSCRCFPDGGTDTGFAGAARAAVDVSGDMVAMPQPACAALLLVDYDEGICKCWQMHKIVREVLARINAAVCFTALHSPAAPGSAIDLKSRLMFDFDSDIGTGTVCKLRLRAQAIQSHGVHALC